MYGSVDIPKPCRDSFAFAIDSWQPGKVEEGVYLSACKGVDVGCPNI
jgi:hypothetical protein